MARSAGHMQESVWLRIFHNSKVNGAHYDGDSLPVHRWAWPRETYLQRRLRAVRADNDGMESNQSGAEARRPDRILH